MLSTGAFAVAIVLVVAIPVVAPPAAAQLPPLVPEAEEIALARSAAPADISRDATIYVLRRGGYVEAVSGSNGFACFVDRIFIESVEPQCFNPEGSRTILRLQMRRAELRERGLTPFAVEQQVEAEFASGALAEPMGLAIGYMYSGAQRIVSDAGDELGRWFPHLMVYRPRLTREEVGTARAGANFPIVWRPGKRDAAMIVVMREFIEPALERG